jgi:SAM-dependent methyltransferase
VRTGRRLRGFDAIIVVHVMPLVVPAHLAMLRAAGVGAGADYLSGAAAPRSIVIAHNVLPQGHRPGDGALTRSLFERVDAVMVNSPEQARLAHDLHAVRVAVANAMQVELPRLQRHAQTPDLSSPWAHYVGAVEALASPHCQAAEQDPPERPSVPSFRTRLAAPVRQRVQRRRPMLAMTRVDLPEWVRHSDVLGDGADADDARDWARSYGLPRCADPVAAWSALGALAAIVRLSDDGHRSAVIVDGSGVRSPLSKWARAIGFAPVELDFTGGRSSVVALDVDTASLDVITQLHPNGCDSEDVDEILSEASWALRPGGLISLTLPLGPASADGAVGPADVRAILARAHSLGFVLVGDLDGDITTLMRAASEGERRSDAAYALVRLTFRRL